MTWKALKQRFGVALSNIVLVLLVIALLLIIASRTFEYEADLETQPSESPEVVVPDAVWVTELPGVVITEDDSVVSSEGN